MATLDESAAFAVDGDARNPLIAAYTAAAISIANEDPGTINHASRVALAYAVLLDPPSQQVPFAWAMSTNQTVVGKWVTGDHAGAMGDIPFVLSTVWDALAAART